MNEIEDFIRRINHSVPQATLDDAAESSTENTDHNFETDFTTEILGVDGGE